MHANFCRRKDAKVEKHRRYTQIQPKKNIHRFNKLQAKEILEPNNIENKTYYTMKKVAKQLWESNTVFANEHTHI